MHSIQKKMENWPHLFFLGRLEDNTERNLGQPEEATKEKRDEAVCSPPNSPARSTSAGKEKLRRRVSWADQLAERKHHHDDEDDDDEDEEGASDDKHSPTDTVRIKYRTRQQSLPAELISSCWESDAGHGPLAKAQKEDPSEEERGQEEEEEEEEAEGEGEGESELTTPQSPSDLYKMFGPHAEFSLGSQPTKGILKKKGDSFQGEGKKTTTHLACHPPQIK